MLPAVSPSEIGMLIKNVHEKLTSGLVKQRSLKFQVEIPAFKVYNSVLIDCHCEFKIMKVTAKFR